MYPQQSTRHIPLVEGGASGKPDHRFTRVDSACNDMIFRRVWGGDPASGIHLQLVACAKGVPSMIPRANEMTHASFC